MHNLRLANPMEILAPTVLRAAVADVHSMVLMASASQNWEAYPVTVMELLVPKIPIVAVTTAIPMACVYRPSVNDQIRPL